MDLYEYRAKSLNPNGVAWDVLELDLETEPYQVREHLTDKERADFCEQFLSLARNVYTD